MHLPSRCLLCVAVLYTTLVTHTTADASKSYTRDNQEAVIKRRALNPENAPNAFRQFTNDAVAKFGHDKSMIAKNNTRNYPPFIQVLKNNLTGRNNNNSNESSNNMRNFVHPKRVARNRAVHSQMNKNDLNDNPKDILKQKCLSFWDRVSFFAGAVTNTTKGGNSKFTSPFYLRACSYLLKAVHTIGSQKITALLTPLAEEVYYKVDNSSIFSSANHTGESKITNIITSNASFTGSNNIAYTYVHNLTHTGTNNFTHNVINNATNISLNNLTTFGANNDSTLTFGNDSFHVYATNSTLLLVNNATYIGVNNVTHIESSNHTAFINTHNAIHIHMNNTTQFGTNNYTIFTYTNNSTHIDVNNGTHFGTDNHTTFTDVNFATSSVLGYATNTDADITNNPIANNDTHFTVNDVGVENATKSILFDKGDKQNRIEPTLPTITTKTPTNHNWSHATKKTIIVETSKNILSLFKKIVSPNV